MATVPSMLSQRELLQQQQQQQQQPKKQQQQQQGEEDDEDDYEEEGGEEQILLKRRQGIAAPAPQPSSSTLPPSSLFPPSSSTSASAWDLLRSLCTNRWLCLAAASWIEATAGVGYMFGLYSQSFKDTLGYDQTLVDMVGMAKDIGGNVGITSGFVGDRFPPWVVLLVGAAQNFVGYFGLWLVLTGWWTDPPVWVVMGLICVGTNGATFFNTAGLVTCVKNFPHSRGPIVGLLKGFIGLSGAVLTQLYLALYAPDHDAFLLMVAWFPAVVAILVIPAIHVLPPPPGDAVDPHERHNLLIVLYCGVALAFFLLFASLLSEFVEGVPRAVPLLVATISWAVLASPAFFAVRQVVAGWRDQQEQCRLEEGAVVGKGNDPVSLVGWEGTQEGGGGKRLCVDVSESTGKPSVIGMSEGGDVAAPKRGGQLRHRQPSPVGRRKGTEIGFLSGVEQHSEGEGLLATSSSSSPGPGAGPNAAGEGGEKKLGGGGRGGPGPEANSKASAKAAAAAAAAAITTEGGSPGQESKVHVLAVGDDHSLLQAAQTLPFWLVYLAMTGASGSGLTAINNLGQLGRSLGYSGEAISVLVALVSIWNFLGRVGGGYVSEYLLKEQGLPRPALMAITQAIMAGGHLLFASALPGSLYLGSVIVGLTYGAQWGLMPTVASEIFGLKYFGTIYNWLTITNPTGSYLLSVCVAGYLYDWEAATEGHMSPPSLEAAAALPSPPVHSRRHLSSAALDSSPSLGFFRLLPETPASSLYSRSDRRYFFSSHPSPMAPAPSPAPQGPLTCHGAHCFRLTFLVMAATCVVSALLSAWLTKITQGYYHNEVAKRRGPVRRISSGSLTVEGTTPCLRS